MRPNMTSDCGHASGGAMSLDTRPRLFDDGLAQRTERGPAGHTETGLTADWIIDLGFGWRARRDSNPQPLDP